jgi:hypothetical protein
MPSTGIPASSLDTPTQSIIDSVASKYVKPAGGIPTTDLSTTVQASLTLANSSVQLGGDLGGTTVDPIITKLQGTSVNASSPTNNQVLGYNATDNAWVPSTVSSTTVNDATSSTPGIIQLAGDLNGGTATTPEVTSTHLASALPINQGGTGSETQNFVDLSSSQTIDGTKTFGSTIAGSISGNAATVTTNADLTGDVTSVGNTTTLTSSANVESIISNNSTVTGKAPLASPALTGIPTAPTATAGTNTTQLATTAFVDTAVTAGAAPDATSSTPGLVQLDGDLGGTATSPEVVRLNGAVSVPSTNPSSSGLVLTTTGSGSTTSWTAPASAPVSSVFGRTGAVTAQSGDYTATEVGALPSTDDLFAIASANATAGNVSMNSHKITNLTNGSNAQDAAAFGQIPTAGTGASNFTVGNATVGGDLSGTLPNPTVARIDGISVSGTPSSGQALIATSSTAASWSTPSYVSVVSPSGDTTGATDVGNINAALTGFPRKKAVLGPGTFYINAPISPQNDTWLQGSGILTTTVKQSSTFSGTTMYQAALSSTISDLSLQGATSTTASNPQADGIYITQNGNYIANVTARNISFTNINGWCVHSYDDGTLGAPVGYFFDNLNDGGGNSGGMSFFGASRTMGFIIQNCSIQASGGTSTTLDGLYVQDVYDIEILNSYFSSGGGANTGHGWHFYGHCSNGRFVMSEPGSGTGTYGTGMCGIKIENGPNGSASIMQFVGMTVQQYDNAVSLQGGCSDISFTDCEFDSSGSDGVVVNTSGSYIRFINCRWAAAGSYASNGLKASGTNYDLHWSGTGTGDVADSLFASSIVASGTAGVQTSVNIASGQQVTFSNVKFKGSGASSTNWFTNMPAGALETSSGSFDFITPTTMKGNLTLDASGIVLNALTPPTGVSSSVSGTSFYYVVTALNVAGTETVASSEVSSGSGTTISWSAATGAVSYKLYRGTSSGGEAGYYATTATSVINADTVTLTGSSAPPTSTVGSGLTIYSWKNQINSTASNPLMVYNQSGSLSFYVNGYGNTNFSGGATAGGQVNSGSTLSSFYVTPPNNVRGVLVVAPNTTSTYNMIEVQSSTNTPVAYIDRSGDITSTALITGEALSASGLTGATAASRHVGATTSGAPISGTFNVGDFIIDQTGKVWVCTTAGSPGTWTQSSGSGATLGANTFMGTQTLDASSIVLNALTPPTGVSSSVSGTSFYYVVTSLNAAGTETTASSEVSSGSGTTISWNAVTGAISYKLYRGTSSSGEAGYYATTATSVVNADTVTLTGTSAPPTSTVGSGIAVYSWKNQLSGTTSNPLTVYSSSGSAIFYVNGYGNTGMTSGAAISGQINGGSTLSSLYVTPGNNVRGVLVVAPNNTTTSNMIEVQSSSNTPVAYVDHSGDITSVATITGQVVTSSGLTGATAASRYVGGTTSGAPTSGTFNLGDFVIDQTGKVWVCTTAGTPGTWSQASGSGATLGANTFTGNQTAPAFVSSGLTGATGASRYVGATTSGAPTSGTFAVGDHVIDQSGCVWVCTTAGTPGNWTGSAGKAQTQIFTSSGTWTMPTNATSVMVFLVSGAGGGGSGGVQASGTAMYGGGGGASGSVGFATFPASLLTSSITVTVGGGGSGGGAISTSGTGGNTGNTGGNSSFGPYLRATGGSGGNGGSTSSGSGGNGTIGTVTSAGGGNSSITSAGGAGNQTNNSGGWGSGGGGGGGGGISTTPTAYAGGSGGSGVANTHGNGGAVGGSNPTADTATGFQGAGGSGGGAASITGNAQAGANGSVYGAGGGGGGAALNGSSSGAGGNGAQGIIIVTTYF